MLRGLGDSPTLSDETVQNAEAFICKVYDGHSAVTSINELRSNMFVNGLTTDKLPPTGDTLLHHIMRSHYQALVWRQAHIQYPQLPPPETMGWILDEGSLFPKLTSLPPVPKACEELISCSCTTGCKTKRCSCKGERIACMASCKCGANCMNI